MKKSTRGSMLIDLMVTVFLLGIVGIVFSATFPTGLACSRKAQNYKIATAFAQKKMEQIRSMNYESLTHPCLFANEVIDATPTGSPFAFTQVEGLPEQLLDGIGSLSVVDVSTSLKRVQITVTWKDKYGTPTRSITLTGVIADKRTRRVT